MGYQPPRTFKLYFDGSWVFCGSVSELLEIIVNDFSDMAEGESFKVESCRLTNADVDALPEFEGW
jgi:hypothetical protein